MESFQNGVMQLGPENYILSLLARHSQSLLSGRKKYVDWVVVRVLETHVILHFLHCIEALGQKHKICPMMFTLRPRIRGN